MIHNTNINHRLKIYVLIKIKIYFYVQLVLVNWLRKIANGMITAFNYYHDNIQDINKNYFVISGRFVRVFFSL